MWSALAALVVLLHAAYLAYQMLGGLLALLDHRWLWPHLVAVGWGVVVVAMRWHCPLTLLEKSLLGRAGAPPYPGSFLDHYVFGRYLPDGTQPVVYTLHLLVIMAVYLLLVRQWWGLRGDRLAHP